MHDRVQIGNRVQVIGYPGDYKDQFGDLPVMHKGMISSGYRLFYTYDPLFLVDSRMHGGTSGSPVFTVVRDQTILIGIHSETYEQRGGVSPDERRLDLNGAWYAELVEGIIEMNGLA